jgi:hypothetical protein
MNRSAPIAAAVFTVVLAVACDDDADTDKGNTTNTSSNGSGASGGSPTTGGTGGTGGSSSTQAGGAGAIGVGGGGTECNVCTVPLLNGKGSMCWTVFEPCLREMACAVWFNCTQMCELSQFNAACFDACNADAAAVQTLYQPVLDCLCMECGRECAPACN